MTSTKQPLASMRPRPPPAATQAIDDGAIARALGKQPSRKKRAFRGRILHTTLPPEVDDALRIYCVHERCSLADAVERAIRGLLEGDTSTVGIFDKMPSGEVLR
jgi:hypothetical protein